MTSDTRIAEALERIASALEVGNAIAAGHSSHCDTNNHREPSNICNCGFETARRAARQRKESE